MAGWKQASGALREVFCQSLALALLRVRPYPHEERPMKNILLVAADASVRAAVTQAFLLHCDEFSLLQVMEPHEAVESMRTHRVDLLITGPSTPVLEGFRLLTYMLNFRSRLPVMVMSPRKKERPSHAPFQVPHLPISLDGDELVSRVRQCLYSHLREQRPAVTLPGLLHVLHQERVTCRLLVVSGERKGKLHLLSGELVHAHCLRTEGDEAAFQVLSWQAPQVLLMGQTRDLRQTLNVRTHRLLALLAARAMGELPGQFPPEQEPAIPRVHQPRPTQESFDAARRTRGWNLHADRRLNWWDQKPKATPWQWWPVPVKPQEK
jgi:DNA-binding response OmpR family regulator